MGATLKYESTDDCKWNFDSGVTSYKTYRTNSFIDMNETDKIEVKMANGSLIKEWISKS